jgi:hypothetical protein
VGLDRAGDQSGIAGKPSRMLEHGLPVMDLS